VQVKNMTTRNRPILAFRSLLAPASTALLVAAVAFVASGCAQEPQKEASENYKPPVYRTGSNLPAGREATASERTSTDAASMPNSMLPKGMQRPSPGS
jgi:hypothetical protein